MKYGRYGWSYFFLRFGLGLTFLWIGVDILRHGDVWIGYALTNAPLGLSRDSVLELAGFLDVVLGLGLLLRVVPKLMSGLAVIHLLIVIAMHGVDATLVRDVGLLGAALALLLWPTHYHTKKGWRQRIFRRGGYSSRED
ncbi:MAG: hypothetical protein ABIH36_01050 [bacterium]